MDKRYIHVGTLFATRQPDGVVESNFRDFVTTNFFNCYLKEVAHAPDEQSLYGNRDDGGISNGGCSTSGASAQADY